MRLFAKIIVSIIQIILVLIVCLPFVVEIYYATAANANWYAFTDGIIPLAFWILVIYFLQISKK